MLPMNDNTEKIVEVINKLGELNALFAISYRQVKEPYTIPARYTLIEVAKSLAEIENKELIELDFNKTGLSYMIRESSELEKSFIACGFDYQTSRIIIEETKEKAKIISKHLIIPYEIVLKAIYDYYWGMHRPLKSYIADLPIENRRDSMKIRIIKKHNWLKKIEVGHSCE